MGSSVWCSPELRKCRTAGSSREQSRGGLASLLPALKSSGFVQGDDVSQNTGQRGLQLIGNPFHDAKEGSVYFCFETSAVFIHTT